MNNNIVNSQKKSKKHLKLALTIIYFGLAIGTFFLITFNYTVKLCLFQLMDFFLQFGRCIGVILIEILGISITLVGIPQTFFQLFLGFTLRNLGLAFALNSLMILVSSVLQFIIAKYWLRRRFQAYFEQQQIFQVFKIVLEGKQNETENNQEHSVLALESNNTEPKQLTQKSKPQGDWKNLLILRFLYLPTFIKNYGIPLFNISFVLFVVTSFPLDCLTGLLLVYVGQSAANIEELMNSNQHKVQKYMLFGILIASGIILTYFSWYARKKIRQLNLEEQGNKDEPMEINLCTKDSWFNQKSQLKPNEAPIAHQLIISAEPEVFSLQL